MTCTEESTNIKKNWLKDSQKGITSISWYIMKSLMTL